MTLSWEALNLFSNICCTTWIFLYNLLHGLTGRKEKMAAWVGTVFGVLGAILVASNSGLNDVGYVFFTVGSSFSLYNAVKMRDNASITLWGVFFLINIFGLMSYLK